MGAIKWSRSKSQVVVDPWKTGRGERGCVRAYVRVCVCVCVRVYVCGGARASARRELGGSQAGINMPGMPRRAGCSPRT